MDGCMLVLRGGMEDKMCGIAWNAGLEWVCEGDLVWGFKLPVVLAEGMW